VDGRAQRRIAFFGGTFDPPHRGHLAVARAAAHRFRLDRVLFAPVARQPLKLESKLTSVLHRYAMVALATAEDPRFVPSQLDVADTGEPNFTVDAIARLRGEEPEAKLFSLIGADAFQSITHWREPRKLLSLCDWIVAARPGYSLDALETALPAGTLCAPLEDDEEGEGLLLLHEHESSTRVLLLKETREDVSATQVRTAVTEDVWKMQDVPPNVADYIRKTGLYQEIL
jgi:nicotinate-nucleotide adenylyltransferase